MPNYFSGTNCRATGSAQVGPVSQSRLYLIGNGETTQVAQFTSDGEFYPLMTSLACTFDSSHYPNGSTVQVRLKVWVVGNSTPYELTSQPVPVRNRAILFEHPDPSLTPDAVPVIANLFYGQNYSTITYNGGSWSSTVYYYEMNGADAVLYCGHGSEASHMMGDGTLTSPTAYLTNRTAHIGTGIPPFNTGAPPINFIHLVACNCGKHNYFTTACYPYRMEWGGPIMEDQGLMAYTVYTYLSEMQGLSEMIWSDLIAGKTGLRAQAEFDQYVTDNPEVFHARDDGATERRPMHPGDLAFYYGSDNGSLRLKTVYTGTNVLPVGWYK